MNLIRFPEELSKEAQAIGAKIYQEAAAEAPKEGEEKKEDVKEGEFEEVKEDGDSQDKSQ